MESSSPKIRRKINFGFLTIALLLWGLCIYSILSTANFEKFFTDFKNKNLFKTTITANIRTELNTIKELVCTYLSGDGIFLTASSKAALEESFQRIAFFSEKYLSYSASQNKKEQKIIAELITSIQKFILSSKQLMEEKSQQQDQPENKQEALKTIIPLFYTVNKKIKDMEDNNILELTETESLIRYQNNIRILKILILGLTATFMALFICKFIDELFMEFMDVNLKNRIEIKQLNQILEKRNIELEKTFYVISHDLKNYLNGIIGFSEILKENMEEIYGPLENLEKSSSTLTPKQKEEIKLSFDQISSAIAYIDSLLEGIRLLSRLGRYGKYISLSMEDIAIKPLILEVIAQFDLQLKDKKIKIEFLGDLPACYADKEQLFRVLYCLIDNAIQYMSADRPGKISFSAKKDKKEIIYCVADNGVGIPKEDLETVFEIFSKLEPGTRPGRGLGLTLVKKIIEKHKGKVEVDSELGKGSKFFISLPLQTNH